MIGDQDYTGGSDHSGQPFKWPKPAADTPAPIATPEEVEQRDLVLKIDHAANAWYIAPPARMPPPYARQTHVGAIVDWASDGSFAGLEIVWDTAALASSNAEIERVKGDLDAALFHQNNYRAGVATLTAEVGRMREALEKIDEWSRAYPLRVFPEPDFKRSAEVLSAAGLSLDRISASNMRHVVEGVGRIARAALTSSNAEIERVKAERDEAARSARTNLAAFAAADARNAALTDQVGRLREALAENARNRLHGRARAEAAEAELAAMKAAAASLNASVIAGSALMAEENLDRQELKQRLRAAEAAEASALTARRDALEEAAKVADREQDECAEHEDNAFTDSVAARWSAAADAAHRIAAGIRTLASTVPGGEETGWRSMESAPRGRHVLLIDTSSGTHVFHSVGFRPPGGGPWETDAGHYMEFTPTGWMALLPPPHEMKEEDLG